MPGCQLSAASINLRLWTPFTDKPPVSRPLVSPMPPPTLSPPRPMPPPPSQNHWHWWSTPVAIATALLASICQIVSNSWQMLATSAYQVGQAFYKLFNKPVTTSLPATTRPASNVLSICLPTGQFTFTNGQTTLHWTVAAETALFIECKQSADLQQFAIKLSKPMVWNIKQLLTPHLLSIFNQKQQTTLIPKIIPQLLLYGIQLSPQGEIVPLWQIDRPEHWPKWWPWPLGKSILNKLLHQKFRKFLKPFCLKVALNNQGHDLVMSFERKLQPDL